MPRRTTVRSGAGRKLYVRRNARGQLADVQVYRPAYGGDIQRPSQAEAGNRRGEARSSRRKAGRSGDR